MANDKFLHERLYRGEAFDKLKYPHILVCGAGALGSNLVNKLTRIGFANVAVLDFDRVDTHNLSTQEFSTSDVGALKVNALKTRVFRNIGVEITALPKTLTADNARTLLHRFDLVADCFDNAKSRKAVQDTCRALRKQCLHVGLYEDYGEVVWDSRYRVPKDVVGDLCDYPLAGGIIDLVVTVAREEILDLYLSEKPRLGSWTITLKDLSIRRVP
jgi:molybdopterin-synthase adenylyltransferase